MNAARDARTHIPVLVTMTLSIRWSDDAWTWLLLTIPLAPLSLSLRARLRRPLARCNPLKSAFPADISIKPLGDVMSFSISRLPGHAGGHLKMRATTPEFAKLHRTSAFSRMTGDSAHFCRPSSRPTVLTLENHSPLDQLAVSPPLPPLSPSVAGNVNHAREARAEENAREKKAEGDSFRGVTAARSRRALVTAKICGLPPPGGSGSL